MSTIYQRNATKEEEEDEEEEKEKEREQDEKEAKEEEEEELQKRHLTEIGGSTAKQAATAYGWGKGGLPTRQRFHLDMKVTIEH